MIKISLLHATDVELAFAIEQRSHPFPWSKQTFVASQGARYLNYRLDVNDRMAAFVITQIVADEATIFNFAVDPCWQRRGVGRQLLTHLIRVLTQRKMMTIWLEVRASNLPAISLYQQLGFNQLAVRHGYYPTEIGREDAHIMALTL